MSTGIFDKVLKIIGIVVNLLQIALKAFTGLNDADEEGDVEGEE